jgi:two-component system, NarL family, sensor histidine kinase UhpB
MRGSTHARSAVWSLPLFWRAFATHASALLLAFTALVFAPITVSVPIGIGELIILAIGLVVVLLLNLVLLRPVFRPLGELADAMRRHDPLEPGERVLVDGEPDVAALAQAFNEMLDRLESERRESARQALRVLEGERSRIARELHDEVGQTLTGAMLQVEALAARIPDDLRNELDELRETARSGTEDVRRIARQLRPEALEDLGLQSALAALATSFGEQTQVNVKRRLKPSLPLSKDEELVVYRVAQEALTNVARHAQATRVVLRLHQNRALTVLTVRDNGRGLCAGALPSAHGIRGMRERAMLIGAQLQIDSKPGRGTEIKLSIPLNPETS